MSVQQQLWTPAELQWLRGEVDTPPSRHRRGHYASTNAEETQRRVKEGLALKLSNRAIAKQTGLDHHTIEVLRDEAAARGEIPQLRESLCAKFIAVSHEAITQFGEALASGKISPSQLPVPAAIAAQKAMELSGTMPAVPTPVHVSITVQELRQMALGAGASESISDAKPCASSTCVALVSGCGQQPPNSGRPTAATEAGGGGSPRPAGPGYGDATPGKITEAKE